MGVHSLFTPSLAVQRIVAHSQRPASRPGPGVISLSSGDPDFPTPEHIRRALAEAIDAGYTHYVDNQGDPELRAALAARVTQIAGRPFSATQVLITHGGSGAITAALLATVNPGDRVLIPEPTYSVYADTLRLIGAEPVFVSQTSDFHLDLDALEFAAPGATMVILCHPCNPTGTVYRRDELEALAALAARHQLLVLADEAYDHIVFDGVEFVSTLAIPGLAERLIYCQTFSKTYAMTGWRLGYLVAPEPIIAAAATVHRTLIGAMNAAVQRAGVAAITIPSDAPELMRREYQARRELVLELLADLPCISIRPPEGTFYAFVRYEADLHPSEVVAKALAMGVAIRSGTEYGPSGAGHVRLAFSTDRTQLTEALLRLRSLFASLA